MPVARQRAAFAIPLAVLRVDAAQPDAQRRDDPRRVRVEQRTTGTAIPRTAAQVEAVIGARGDVHVEVDHVIRRCAAVPTMFSRGVADWLPPREAQATSTVVASACGMSSSDRSAERHDEQCSAFTGWMYMNATDRRSSKHIDTPPRREEIANGR